MLLINTSYVLHILEPICIVIELVEGGNLQQLLRKTRVPYLQQKGYENIRSRLTDRDLVTIALNIAKGMSHLHDKQVIIHLLYNESNDWSISI